MSRLEKRRQKKRLRLKAFLGIMLCLVLFCCGLSIVDASSRDMLGRSSDRPIFGIYGLKDEVIRLEVAGREILVDKSGWDRVYQAARAKIDRLIK